ncbi:MAG: hypothetical protein ACREFY_16590, partial [Acetobacteraceae bacterium]
RKAIPVLRSAHFMHGQFEPLPGIIGAAWFDETGQALPEEAWSDPEGRLLALRRAGAAEPPGRGTDVVLVLINGTDADRAFALPEPAFEWRVLLDSSRDGSPESERMRLDAAVVAPGPFTVVSRSVVLLGALVPPAVADPQGQDPKVPDPGETAPETASSGASHPETPDLGAPDPDIPNPGTPDAGAPDPGIPDSEAPSLEAPNPGASEPEAKP